MKYLLVITALLGLSLSAYSQACDPSDQLRCEEEMEEWLEANPPTCSSGRPILMWVTTINEAENKITVTVFKQCPDGFFGIAKTITCDCLPTPAPPPNQVVFTGGECAACDLPEIKRAAMAIAVEWAENSPGCEAAPPKVVWLAGPHGTQQVTVTAQVTCDMGGPFPVWLDIWNFTCQCEAS